MLNHENSESNISITITIGEESSSNSTNTTTWQEVCNTEDFPNFDPTYFDEECKQYRWCYKYYDPETCEPLYASGYTEREARIILSTFWMSPLYIFGLLFMVALPFWQCVYVLSGDLSTCSYGWWHARINATLITDENGYTHWEYD